MSREDWVFLTSVVTEVEADIIFGLLEQEGIPVRKAYPGLGNLKAAFGIISGVEIYVPEDCVEQAKEILSADSEMLMGNLVDSDLEADEEK